MTSSLRRRCDMETVHGIMILVMRDMGCAQYFQAWLWLGKLGLLNVTGQLADAFRL